MKRDFKFYAIEFPEEFAICILGRRLPTINEAEKFLSEDIEKLQLGKVLEVYEIDEGKATSCYDMENMDRFPIFGK